MTDQDLPESLPEPVPVAGPVETPAEPAADIVVPVPAVSVKTPDPDARSLRRETSLRTVIGNARDAALQAAHAARDVAARASVTARGVADVASDAAREMAGMASETAKGVAEIAGETARSVLQVASESAQVVAQLAEDGAKIAAQIAGDSAKAASQLAREVALQMAQAYLRKSTLTLALPEAMLNKQIRQMARDYRHIDHITVYCGDDRLSVAVDRHHNRLVYTVQLDFDVLECKISRDEQYLRVRQVGEELDAQFRQGGVVSNWATRQVARGAFFIANRMPTRSPVNQALAEIPGMRREGPRLWRIDLEKSALIELLNNRSWMVEKLLSFSDITVLPGLSTLKDSRDLLQQLVNQFDIRDLRVRPGRVEVLVGINPS